MTKPFIKKDQTEKEKAFEAGSAPPEAKPDEVVPPPGDPPIGTPPPEAPSPASDVSSRTGDSRRRGPRDEDPAGIVDRYQGRLGSQHQAGDQTAIAETLLGDRYKNLLGASEPKRSLRGEARG